MNEIVPGYEAYVWDAVGAPANTPADVIGKVNTALNDTLAYAGDEGAHADRGAEPMIMTPAESANSSPPRLKKSGKVIRQAGIKPE